MNDYVLVDADVISGYFGRNRSLKDRPEMSFLEDLFALGLVRVTGHVFQEVLNGFEKGQVGTYRKMRNRLKNKIIAPTVAEYELSIDICRNCSGFVLSITDLINCGVSVSRGYKILAFDKDYEGVRMCDRRVKFA